MTRLVLASNSFIRKQLLTAAGVLFDVDAADLDEDAIGAGTAAPQARAMLLAVAKATVISKRHPGRYVIGGDQVGVLDDGSALHKPKDHDDHRALLLRMAGRCHTFHPAACVVKDGVVLARVHDSALVTFRAFGADVADALARSAQGRGSCGGYESENRGAQLIAHVEGSLHAVLGFPLLQLLDALRGLAIDIDGLMR